MRTTIRLNTELARKAKSYAQQNHRSFTEIVEEALIQLIESPVNGKASAKKKMAPLPTFGSGKHRITEKQYRAAIEQMYSEEAEQIVKGTR